MPNYDPRERTRTLARVVGPYLIVAAAAMFMRQSSLPAFFSAFMADEPLVFVAGAFTLIAGLAILGAHHHWGGFSAAIISLIGLLATGKGAALMLAPQFGVEATGMIVRTPSIMLGSIGVDLALGLWLTFAGWRPQRAQPMPT